MKYVILHGEGLVDRPDPELGDKTPLQAADTPNMDGLVRAGELGLAGLPLEGTLQTHGLTSLGLLGYDPRKFARGPAPFEAAGLGVALGEQDVAFCCSIVTLRPEPQPSGAKAGGAYSGIKKLGPHVVLDDDTAGCITTEEARELIDAVNEQLGSETIQFYPGSGHRHLMVWVGGKAKAVCVDPQEALGRSIGDTLPSGDGADILRKLMEASLIILGSHPVNDQRLETGLKPANCLWLWGQGKALRLPAVQARFRVRGAVLSTSDLVRGVGVCAGLETTSPETLMQNGALDFPSCAEQALRELQTKDFLYLHMELPVEPAGQEDPKARCETLERFDRSMIGGMLTGLKKLGIYRLLLVGERRVGSKRPGEPSSTAVYALAQPSGSEPAGTGRGFNEPDAEAAQPSVRELTKLVTRLFAN